MTASEDLFDSLISDVTSRFAKFFWRLLLVDCAVMGIAVEVLRRVKAPFHGFAPGFVTDTGRIILFGVILALFFGIPVAMRAALKKGESADPLSQISARRRELLVAGALCELIALGGFSLFLLAGAYKDFWVAVALAALYGFRYVAKRQRDPLDTTSEQEAS